MVKCPFLFPRYVSQPFFGRVRCPIRRRASHPFLRKVGYPFLIEISCPFLGMMNKPFLRGTILILLRRFFQPMIKFQGNVFYFKLKGIYSPNHSIMKNGINNSILPRKGWMTFIKRVWLIYPMKSKSILYRKRWIIFPKNGRSSFPRRCGQTLLGRGYWLFLGSGDYYFWERKSHFIN